VGGSCSEGLGVWSLGWKIENDRLALIDGVFVVKLRKAYIIDDPGNSVRRMASM
jgi:hypothetical protein